MDNALTGEVALVAMRDSLYQKISMDEAFESIDFGNIDSDAVAGKLDELLERAFDDGQDWPSVLVNETLIDECFTVIPKYVRLRMTNDANSSSGLLGRKQLIIQ